MEKISQSTGSSYLKFCGTGKPETSDKDKYINRGERLEEAKDSSHLLDSLDKLRPDKFLLVHLTDHLPKDGVIKSTKEATRDENGVSQYRNTIHFALNHAVQGHNVWSWDDKKFAVLAPLDKTMQRTAEDDAANGVPAYFTKRYASKDDVIGGEVRDFFIKKQVKLPKGSVIVRKSSGIPKGKLRVVDPATIEELKNTKGIKVLETSESIHDVANDVVEMMGYTNIRGSLRKDRSALAMLNPTPEYREQARKEQVLIEAWEKFCKENDLESCKHTASVYGRSEALLECIKILAVGGNSWVHTLSDKGTPFSNAPTGDIDYKEEFLQVISEIQESVLNNNPLLHFFRDKLQENADETEFCYNAKTDEEMEANLEKLRKWSILHKFMGFEGILSYDIQRLSAIVRHSETPQKALDRIKEDLKLIPMVSTDECKQIQEEERGEATPEDLYFIMDPFIGLSKANKNVFNGNP